MNSPVRIEVEEEGTRLIVAWDDDRVDRHAASQVRNSCACADCRAEVDAAPNPALRLAAPTLTKIAGAELVGSYGIQFTFMPDGHSTGIFTFAQLRALGDE